MYTFTAKVLDKIEYEPGAWTGLKIGIFRIEGDSEAQIGEYERDYPSLFNTFYHFRKGDQDYALYSPDYTATRVMELPTCQDIGGEEPHSAGFCPVDYYVPSYIDREYVDLQDKVHQYRVNEPKPTDMVTKNTKWYPRDEKTGQRIEVEKPSYPISPVLFYPFGFVAGCIWGDDSSWKIQFLDLSEVEKGIIKREERFGYIAMPSGMTLKQAIERIDYPRDSSEEDGYRITIAIQRRFDLHTGKTLDNGLFG